MVQTATPQLPVYYIVVRTRSKDENGPHIGERFGVSSVLILALNLVGCNYIYLCSSCDARLMCAMMMDLTVSYFQCSFNGARFPSWVPSQW